MVDKKKTYSFVFTVLIAILVATLYIKKKFEKPSTVKKIKKVIKKLEQPNSSIKKKEEATTKETKKRTSPQLFSTVTQKAKDAGAKCEKLTQELKSEGIIDKGKILNQQKFLDLFQESFLQKIAPNYNQQIIKHTFSKSVDAESAYDYFFNYKIKAKNVCLPLKWIVYLHKLVKRDKEYKEQALQVLKAHFDHIFFSKSLFNEARNYATTLNSWACLQSKAPFSFCKDLKRLTIVRKGDDSYAHEVYDRIQRSENNADYNKENYQDFLTIIRKDIEFDNTQRDELKLYFDEYINSL